MPRFKAIIRNSNQFRAKDNTYRVYIQVTHKRKTRYIPTKYHIFSNQINPDTGVIKNHYNEKYMNVDIKSAILEFEKLMIDYEDRVEMMSINDLVSMLKSPSERHVDFYSLTKKMMDEFLVEGRDNYVVTFRSTISMLEKFTLKKVIPFKEINYQFIRNFELFMRMRGSKTNTIGIYLRNIRTVFNMAIRQGIIDQKYYPFKGFEIKKEVSQNRNLSIEEIRLIRDYKTNLKGESLSKDMFMLSFYLAGINMIDLFNLKEITKGRIVFQRSKTGNLVSLLVTLEIKEIIKKYKGKEYVLNILEMYGFNHRNLLRYLNFNLQKIADKIGIKHLSTYYARHTWATIAAELDIPTEIISMALGHSLSNSLVTEIYIKRKLEKVDEAIKKVINYLMDSEGQRYDN